MSSADRGVPISFPTRSQTSLDLRVRTIAREVEMESPGFETGAYAPRYLQTAPTPDAADTRGRTRLARSSWPPGRGGQVAGTRRDRAVALRRRAVATA
jgi:hypothetical protein